VAGPCKYSGEHAGFGETFNITICGKQKDLIERSSRHI
jgi:hypothetical protein